jgi:hypothetical protein
LLLNKNVQGRKTLKNKTTKLTVTEAKTRSVADEVFVLAVLVCGVSESFIACRGTGCAREPLSSALRQVLVAPSLCVFGKIFSFWLKTVLRGLGTWGLV